MARRSERSVAAVVGISTAVLAAFIITFSAITVRNGTSPDTGTSPPGTESAQNIYAARLHNDEQSLDRGVLTYSPIGSLKTATTTQFTVIVTDVGRGAQQGPVTTYNGMVVYQQDVPTGGVVAVRDSGLSESDMQERILSWPASVVSRQLRHLVFADHGRRSGACGDHTPSGHL